jgi:hypothetical protein
MKMDDLIRKKTGIAWICVAQIAKNQYRKFETNTPRKVIA